MQAEMIGYLTVAVLAFYYGNANPPDSLSQAFNMPHCVWSHSMKHYIQGQRERQLNAPIYSLVFGVKM
jgi:hypothetical protein